MDSSDSEEFSEPQQPQRLACDCVEIHRVDEDDDEVLSSFTRDPEDACWVSESRLGVPINCRSQDLVTVEVTEDDVRTLCHEHLELVNQHHCCWNCLTLVVTGTFLECPAGHRTDPLCKTLKQKMEEGEPRSCSHCGSTALTENQIHLELEDSDESQVTAFTKLIEELEEAVRGGLVQQQSVVDLWKERMRALAPQVLNAFRHAPQKISALTARMYAVLQLIDDEELDLMMKLMDLGGVAQPNRESLIMSSMSTALESVWYDGTLPFKYTHVVTDPYDLTELTDEKAIMFCDCEGVCMPEKCNCCTGDYSIDKSTNETIIPSIRPSMGAVSECGPACSCRTDCGNRLVQNGGKPYGLELFATRDRGLGVRAKEAIPKGRFIIEYAGEVRKMDETDVTNNYCFETVLGLQRVEIDAQATGSAARCFNHSCNPNAVLVKVAWDPVEERRLFHLAVFSLEDISKGKEITIDYGDAFWDAKIYEFACLCGTEYCRHNEETRQEKLRLAEEDRESIEDEYSSVNEEDYGGDEEDSMSDEGERTMMDDEEGEEEEVYEDVDVGEPRDEEESEINVIDV